LKEDLVIVAVLAKCGYGEFPAPRLSGVSSRGVIKGCALGKLTSFEADFASLVWRKVFLIKQCDSISFACL